MIDSAFRESERSDTLDAQLRLCFKVVAFIIGALLLSSATIGAPGDLDPLFGQKGRVTLGFDQSNIAHARVTEAGDGKILFARDCTYSGDASTSICVTRLTKNGAIDDTFASQGTRKIAFTGVLIDLVIDADNRFPDYQRDSGRCLLPLPQRASDRGRKRAPGLG